MTAFSVTPWASERFERLIDERWRSMPHLLTICAFNAGVAGGAGTGEWMQTGLPDVVESRLRDRRRSGSTWGAWTCARCAARNEHPRLSFRQESQATARSNCPYRRGTRSGVDKSPRRWAYFRRTLCPPSPHIRKEFTHDHHRPPIPIPPGRGLPHGRRAAQGPATGQPHRHL